MALEETRKMIATLGWHVIATKKHHNGVSFDATDYRVLAKGAVCATEDAAMLSCLDAILEKGN